MFHRLIHRIENYPAVILGARLAVQRPRQPIGQGDLGGKPWIVLEQIKPRVAEIEFRSQQQRHQSVTALQRETGEPDGVTFLLSIWRVRHNPLNVADQRTRIVQEIIDQIVRPIVCDNIGRVDGRAILGQDVGDQVIAGRRFPYGQTGNREMPVFSS